MKRILSLLTISIMTLTTISSVVACNNINETKFNVESLDGSIFNVRLNSFNDPSLEPAKDNQNQWGQNSIGALYSTLWTINNKKAQEKYPIQNKDVAAYLTQGESLNRHDLDDGSDVFLNGKNEKEKHAASSSDWHKDSLSAQDKVIFKMTCTIYGNQGKVLSIINVNITINIIN